MGLFHRKPRVTVSLVVHGPATRYLTAGDYEVPAGSKLKVALKAAGLGGAMAAMICLIEGERVELSQRLNGGETITVTQFIAGG